MNGSSNDSLWPPATEKLGIEQVGQSLGTQESQKIVQNHH